MLKIPGGIISFSSQKKRSTNPCFCLHSAYLDNFGWEKGEFHFSIYSWITLILLTMKQLWYFYHESIMRGKFAERQCDFFFFKANHFLHFPPASANTKEQTTTKSSAGLPHRNRNFGPKLGNPAPLWAPGARKKFRWAAEIKNQPKTPKRHQLRRLEFRPQHLYGLFEPRDSCSVLAREAPKHHSFAWEEL